VLRGPSCSGKTTTALAVRQAVGRGVAVVQQDVIRRELLRERDQPGALNIDLISLIVTRCLAADYDVILEGILDASRYGTALRAIITAHPGPAHVCYFALPLDETLRRHATKPNATGYGPRELAEWYVPDDLLSVPHEKIIRVVKARTRSWRASSPRPCQPAPQHSEKLYCRLAASGSGSIAHKLLTDGR